MENDRLRESMLAGRTEDDYLAAGDRIGPYLTLMGGRMYEHQNIRYATALLKIMLPPG